MQPNTSYETLDLMKDPNYAAGRLKFHAEGKGMPTVHITSFAYLPLSFANPEAAPAVVQNIERKVEELKESGQLPPGVAEQYEIQLRKLRDPAVPDCEIIILPGSFGAVHEPLKSGASYLTVAGVVNHPFSRGSIHARSADPKEYPAVDPDYFEIDYDLELLIEEMHLTRRLLTQEPFKSAISREIYPGPECNTEAQLRDAIMESAETVWHTVGSCSMMPRNKNGVVSPELIVYGTKNLRVADLSIIPLHIAAHTQSTAYVIGEKAADLILGH